MKYAPTHSGLVNSERGCCSTRAHDETNAGRCEVIFIQSCTQWAKGPPKGPFVFRPCPLLFVSRPTNYPRARSQIGWEDRGTSGRNSGTSHKRSEEINGRNPFRSYISRKNGTASLNSTFSFTSSSTKNERACMD